MSDLISRQALLNELEHDLACFETENKSEKEMYIAVSDMRRMIEEQPTAYDVDKVVKQMTLFRDAFAGDEIYLVLNNALKIIKAGGVNE